MMCLNCFHPPCPVLLLFTNSDLRALFLNSIPATLFKNRNCSIKLHCERKCLRHHRTC
uniref:Uncharacterized protein n=1 Tax=Arundo donax TaxID=35708 RepID=A0A0A9AUW1_ARUDO